MMCGNEKKRPSEIAKTDCALKNYYQETTKPKNNGNEQQQKQKNK